MFVNKSENEYSENITDPVLFYAGEFGYCFSNFAAFTVTWKDRKWLTSEHAYQAAGFDEPDIVQEIADANSAHDALRIAIKHKAKLRASWEDEKRAIMKDICREKLHQHQYVEKTLRNTKNAELIEDSPKDEYWGRGKDWNGQNWLGKIWMELRDELK